jgi:imidazolonepropionase-like amidohydrolase
MGTSLSSARLVIRNGTLIDGSGGPPRRNDSILIEGNRIRSLGPAPEAAALAEATVIDASGHWIMPGLIDGHVHLSYGYPLIKGEGRGRGTSRPELHAIRAAHNAWRVLRSGVTSISVPGGSWFTDVGVRDAIRLGLIEGPRITCGGRAIITYGNIEDEEPAWVGTPDHLVGKLCNTVAEMVTEVRHQGKRGVDFVKLADSRSGEFQGFAQQEISAVVEEAHRRNLRVAIHSRGSGSTRAAAYAGVDCIIHADLAADEDLDLVAEKGIRVMPTSPFLAKILETDGRPGNDVQFDVAQTKRYFDGMVNIMRRARDGSLKFLAGSDTGNNPFMRYGELHTKEAEILVNHAGYSTMEAIVAMTRNNAWVMGLEDELGEIRAGCLADILILERDPLADLRILQGGRHLAHLIKDGRIVDLGRRPVEQLRFQEALA